MEAFVKLSIRHTFACTPDEFWQMFWEPELDDRMQTGTAVARTLLEDKTEGGLRIQRYRFVPERTLPGPIAKIAGTDKLSYETENRFDPATKVLNWRVVPAVLPDKVTAQGTFTVRAIPEGCERLVDGTIEVRVPFVGGKIEQTIVESVEQGYEAAAKVMREYFAEKKGS